MMPASRARGPAAGGGDPVDWLIIVAAIAAISLVALLLASRLRRGRSPEELLEEQAMQAERDRARTEAIHASDRYNTRR
jgi:hypothetical protein